MPRGGSPNCGSENVWRTFSEESSFVIVFNAQSATKINPSRDVVIKSENLNVCADPGSWNWCRTRPSVVITSNHGGLQYDTTTLSPEDVTPQQFPFTPSTVPGVSRPPLTCTSCTFLQLVVTAACSRRIRHNICGPSGTVIAESVDPVLLPISCTEPLVLLESRRESGDIMTMSRISHVSVHTFKSGRRLNLTLLKSEEKR